MIRMRLVLFTRMNVLIPFGIGQLIAVLMSLSSFASSSLSSLSFNFPALQTVPVYICLAFCLFKVKKLHHPWWAYFLVAVSDFFANYCIVRALSLTSMTSAQLLNSSTVPFVVFLSFLLFRRKPSLYQILGLVVAVSGLGCVIYADILKRGVDQDNHWIGNCLSLTAAFLYAACNCLEEKVLVNGSGSCLEMLGMLGFWGTLLSSSQSLISESVDISQVTWEVFGYWSCFTLSMVSFYGLLSFFLSRWDASLFNLSILTASVYSAIIESIVTRYFQLGYWLYGLGFFLTLAGCAMYHGSVVLPSSLPK